MCLLNTICIMLFGASSTQRIIVLRTSAAHHNTQTTCTGTTADKMVSVQAAPYLYEMPVDKTALIMIDFQKDFMCEGGFGAALGNDVKQLQVRVY